MLEHMAQGMDDATSPHMPYNPTLLGALSLPLPLAASSETVLALAEEEARRFNHNYIGTEHLLLGVVRQPNALTASILTQLHIELRKVRNAVEFIIGRGDQIVLGEIGMTPRAKKVMELAADEARRIRHPTVGAEHLLLGMVREGEGIAAGVLESLGVRLDKLRDVTLAALRQRDASGAEPQG